MWTGPPGRQRWSLESATILLQMLRNCWVYGALLCQYLFLRFCERTGIAANALDHRHEFVQSGFNGMRVISVVSWRHCLGRVVACRLPLVHFICEWVRLPSPPFQTMRLPRELVAPPVGFSRRRGIVGALGPGFCAVAAYRMNLIARRGACEIVIGICSLKHLQVLTLSHFTLRRRQVWQL